MFKFKLKITSDFDVAIYKTVYAENLKDCMINKMQAVFDESTKKYWIFNNSAYIEVVKKKRVELGYDFFLFSMLVNDVIIAPNNLSIPYDLLYEYLISYYAKSNFVNYDLDVAYYDQLLEHITSDLSLLQDLQKISD